MTLDLFCSSCLTAFVLELLGRVRRIEAASEEVADSLGDVQKLASPMYQCQNEILQKFQG